MTSLSYDKNFKHYQKLSLSIFKEFGFGKDIMEARINREVTELVKCIKEVDGKSFYPKSVVFTAIENVIASILFGERVESDTKFTKEILDSSLKIIDATFAMFPLNAMPALRFLPHFRKLIDILSSEMHKFYGLTEMKIDELLAVEGNESFVSCFARQEGPGFDREQLIFELKDLVAGGSDTSSNTVLWSIVLLANNPKVQERIQKEIDDVVPRDRFPSLSDKPKMAYVEAAILELMRRKTIVQNGFPHLTACDTEVCGYFIPKNTMVICILRFQI